MTTNTAAKPSTARSAAAHELEAARDHAATARAPLAERDAEIEQLNSEIRAIDAQIEAAVATADSTAPVRELSRRRRQLKEQFEDAAIERSLQEAIVAEAERRIHVAAIEVNRVEGLEVVERARQVAATIESHLQAIAEAYGELVQLRTARDDAKARIQHHTTQAHSGDIPRGVDIPYVPQIGRAIGLRFDFLTEIAHKVKTGAHREQER